MTSSFGGSSILSSTEMDEVVRLDRIEAQIEQLLLSMVQQVHQQKHQQDHTQGDGWLTTWLTLIENDHPPTFEGQEDPILLKNWIRYFDKLYTAVNFPLERRVNMAAYYLRERADDWWRVCQAVQAEQNLTWDQFKEALWKQFYPEHVKRKTYDELLALRQGGMSVREYYAEFVELIRLFPEVTASGWPETFRFVRGLNYYIQDKLEDLLFIDLWTVYERACNIFRLLKEKSEALGSTKRKHEDDQQWNEIHHFEHVKREKYDEFLTLRQGGMAVEEYYTKFVELVRFAPDVAASDWLKAYHFEHGLNYNIRIQLACVLSTDLNIVYERARNIFHVLKGMSKALGGNEMKHEGDQQPGKDNRMQFGGKDKKNITQGMQGSGRPTSYMGGQVGFRGSGDNLGYSKHYHCTRCNRDHLCKDCRRNLVVCYGCGKKGHKVFQCRQLPGDGM